MTPDPSFPAWAPLARVKVLDFTSFLPGPFISAILADLGAVVVKVDPPAGEAARHYQADLFAAVNRGKRSIALDLKDPASRPTIEALATWADLVVESGRPGVAERLGIAYGDLSAINPGLVYCSLSSYGRTGPKRDHPAHDINIMAAAGGLGLPSHWSRPPSRSSLPVGDFTAGALAASAIMAALTERATTGQGRYLDASLFATVLYCASMRHGLDAPEDERAHLTPSNDLYRTADGKWIALGMMEDHFWQRFADLMRERAPALADPVFARHEGRQAEGARLAALLAEVIAGEDAAYWAALTDSADLPIEICVPPHEAAASAQAQAMGATRRTAPGGLEVVFPVRVDDLGAADHPPAPALNADAEDILEMVGLSPATASHGGTE